MDTIEMSIHLDPVKDGPKWMPKKVMRADKAALIIGTNGQFRFADEDETYDIIDRLSAVSTSDRMGKTDFLIIYNSDKMLRLGDGRFLVGSAVVMKSETDGPGLLTFDEAESAIREFKSRIVTLCSGDSQFSAYELD